MIDRDTQTLHRVDLSDQEIDRPDESDVPITTECGQILLWNPGSQRNGFDVLTPEIRDRYTVCHECRGEEPTPHDLRGVTDEESDRAESFLETIHPALENRVEQEYGIKTLFVWAVWRESERDLWQLKPELTYSFEVSDILEIESDYQSLFS